MVALWEVPLGAVIVALVPLCPTAEPYAAGEVVAEARSEGGGRGCLSVCVRQIERITINT